jgi:phosphoglycerol transferase MdoB-like AlkP superfamily enzyme
MIQKPSVFRIQAALADATWSRFPYLPISVSILLLIISTTTRIGLMIREFDNYSLNFGNVTGILGIGLCYDLVNALYFILPVMLLGWIVPLRIATTRWFASVMLLFMFLMIFLLLLNAVSEWIFWDEFNSRFNFIAVDYLVYTTEVLGNIRESYPVSVIIVTLVIVALLIQWLGLQLIKKLSPAVIGFRTRSAILLAYLAAVCASYIWVSSKGRQFSENNYVNELAANGMYELFAAYRNNELDYKQFYQTLEEKEAFAALQLLIQTPESHFTGNNPLSIEREIRNTGGELHKNVVLISVESLSADFLGSFGNKQHITPFLDSIAKQSVLFTNLYATGTRTVRGLEALSLAIPPTPGQSIVRRPGNEDLFSLGSVFKDKGYDTKFIYGGYGYFDNMGYFFDHNSYRVIDRTALSKKEIDYENIWGVADENLFELAEREIEKSIKNGKPVFAHIMTTSNHRPFTYPEGRIDIPSHTGREGAVKYTDYTIGRFIQQARTRPWFKNTLFVIVADHCASSAGKTDLPVNRYKIPMLIYSPDFIAPSVMPRLMSQIDLAPTVLGLLNFSYHSKFFGYDIYKLQPGRERAFISTYQSLGYLRDDTLITLKPQKVCLTSVPDMEDGSSRPTKTNGELTLQAISWYQCASTLFRDGSMKRKH